MKLKFLSLNIWNGGRLIDNVIAFLREEDADIVVLQEVYNGTDPSLDRQCRSMQILGEALGYGYQEYVPFYRDFDIADGKAECGTAILSKFPIKSSNHVFFDGEYTETYTNAEGEYWKCPHALLHVVCETPAGEANVYNLHGVWDLDGDNYSEKRRDMAEAVVNAVKGKTNVLLGGDTNAKMTNQAILDIEKHLHNVFGRELTSTFNMRRKDNPGYATAAVDTIFVSPDIQVLDKTCHDVDVSDHLPVSAIVKIGGNDAAGN